MTKETTMDSMTLTPETMKRGGRYNWKGQPERLIYLRRFNGWHQFKKIGDPREVWCEVLDEDLHRLEETVTPDHDMTGPLPKPGERVEAPSPEDAHAMGAAGGPAHDGERLAFEAWMSGHCWALCATWTGTEYRSDAEQGGRLDPQAMMTRRLWAAWRDRAALAAQPAAEARPVALTYPSRQSLFLRACGHPSVLEIMADCADCIDTENDAQHDPECGAYDGSKWRALAAELRRSAAAIRAEDPEIWSDAPPARPVAPAGWQLVPVEPTPEMLHAGNAADYAASTHRPAKLIYRAMLSASPAAPAPVALTEEQTFEPISDHEQAALYRHCEGTDHYPVVRRLYRNSRKLPPDRFERERAATICDDLAEMMERGAGECAPGERLRQAARNIREGRPPLSDVCISAPSAEG